MQLLASPSVFLFLLACWSMTAHQLLMVSAACYETSSDGDGLLTISNCTCHESCNDCTKQIDMQDAGYFFCLDCSDGSDLIPLFPQINSNVSDPDADVFCQGGCREHFFGLTTSGECDSCFNTTTENATTAATCDDFMGAVCGLSATCNVCKDRALALIDCLAGLSTDEYLELLLPVQYDDCGSELPQECKASPTDPPSASAPSASPPRVGSGGGGSNADSGGRQGVVVSVAFSVFAIILAY